MSRADATRAWDGQGDDEVVWLERGSLRRRGGALGRSAAACACGAAALSALLLFGNLPPGVPRAEASADAHVPPPAGSPAPDSLAALVGNAAPVPAPAEASAPAAAAEAPTRAGLTGAAAASLVRDPAAAVLDKVSPEAVAVAVETAGPSDPDEVMTFGPVRIRRWIVATILRAARETGSDPVLLMAIADKESSFVTHVKARTSSAEGLYQFISRTWLKVVKQYGAAHGLAAEADMVEVGENGHEVADPQQRQRILELRRDPYLSAVLAAEMLKGDSARIASRIGRELTHGEIYIAHFLGPDDAETFMRQVVATPGAVAAALLPKPARANRPIFYVAGKRKPRGLSVAQVHRKFEDMIGLRSERYRSVAGMGAGMGAGAPLAYASAEVKAP